MRARTPMVAYFIRRSRDDCAVIKLYPDDREEIVQDSLSLLEAEILWHKDRRPAEARGAAGLQ
jgi:hypothetical protein